MKSYHAVETDGTVTTDLDPKVRALLERIARSGHMIQMHRQGIALNQRRILDAQAELDRLQARQ
jgi:hypothetical protein